MLDIKTKHGFNNCITFQGEMHLLTILLFLMIQGIQKYNVKRNMSYTYNSDDNKNISNLCENNGKNECYTHICDSLNTSCTGMIRVFSVAKFYVCQ